MPAATPPDRAVEDDLRARLAHARSAMASATDALASARAFGLAPAIDAAPPAPIGAAPHLALAGRPLEAWALAAGEKRVAFVTVAPADEAATRAHFAGCHVERRERAVAIGPGDRWRDDRTSGAPRVELYAAHDAADARRAAALQAEDPTRNARELGALLGYPPCCVAAFIAQGDRSDNTLNRYLIAARTDDDGARLPWCLNELHVRLIAFYPCRYTCAAARAVAEATIAAIETASPGFTAAARASLARTVLYLDHDHQLWLRGDADRYAGVDVVGRRDGLAPLAAALAAGDRARWAAEALIVDGASATTTVARRAPHLGLWLRFG